MQSDVLGAESISKDFPPFNGNLLNFKTFRTKTSLIISYVLKYCFIHDTATVCKHVLLTEYNTCTATKHLTFSTKFENYAAEKFSVPLEAAVIPHKLMSQSALWMVDRRTTWARAGQTLPAWATSTLNPMQMLSRRIGWTGSLTVVHPARLHHAHHQGTLLQ
eukprot:3263335-Rhodomonas_salina.1